MLAVGIDEVRAAAERIAPFVHRTPILTSRTLDAEIGAEVFCKAENLQKIGAFKARGACNFLFSMTDADLASGVVTHSSGNHAAAVAWAASLRSVPCTVVMPDTAAPIKQRAVASYGARIVLCRKGERELVCQQEQERTGAVFVPPYDDPRIIAGQGTAALELLAQVGPLDMVVAPVGGGGLLAGTTIVVRSLAPSARVLGAEPATADDAFRSLRDGVRHPPSSDPQTNADGLLTGLGVSNFEILRDGGVEVVVVGEAEILDACRFHLLRMKTLVEPSGAVSLAAIRTLGPAVRGRRVGLIMSGGNTDLNWLARG